MTSQLALAIVGPRSWMADFVASQGFHVTIADPDGYRLTFTAPQPHMLSGHRPSFDEVIARVRDSVEGSRGESG